MIRIRDISLTPDKCRVPDLEKRAAKILGVGQDEIEKTVIRRRSVDARKKNDVRIIFTADFQLKGGDDAVLSKISDGKVSKAENFTYEVPAPAGMCDDRSVVVGFGPGGMFAALTLAMAGLRPIVLERGYDVDKRKAAVERFWETGELDTVSNVQFGEGGAGTFSDGKLNTGTKNPRIGWVLEQMHRFGAAENIMYDAKPHVGTDVLRNVVKNLREEVIALGGEIRFETKMTKIISENGRVTAVETEKNGEKELLGASKVILAIGHSARDTFEMLNESGIHMEAKPFSIGVRIEHPQSEIDKSQYGGFAGHKALGAADYKLNCRTESGDAYTFCMCPGGYVVAAASEEGGVVTNGMSYSGRDGKNANSALLVGVEPADFPYEGVLGGMYWQREIERKAFAAGGGNYAAPCQSVGDFLGKPSANTVTPSYKPGTVKCSLEEVLPKKVTDTIREALPVLEGKLRGFASPNAVMTAPETRSSSPVRILRDGNKESSLKGLYPCGEGAGYAGGITSAAVDGILCAEAVIESL